MLKETITFEDFDGNSVTEDFYFNLSRSELVAMTLSVKGGLEEYLKTIVKSEDSGLIMASFQDILAQSVGERSSDGRSFLKTDDYTRRFMQSNAYEELFLKIVTDPEYAANFIQGVVPKDLEKLVGKSVEDVKPREYTDQELLQLPQAEFDRVAGTDPRFMKREHLVIAMRRRTHEAA